MSPRTAGRFKESFKRAADDSHIGPGTIVPGPGAATAGRSVGRVLASNIANADTPNYKARRLQLPARRWRPPDRAAARVAPASTTVPVAVTPAAGQHGGTGGQAATPPLQCNTAPRCRTPSTAIRSTWTWNARTLRKTRCVTEATLRFINGQIKMMTSAINGPVNRTKAPPCRTCSSIFDVSRLRRISAQSQRLNVVASNLANAESVAGPDGQTYKARQVVFQTQMFGRRPARRLGRRAMSRR